MCRTFTSGSHLTNHQMIHPSENLASVQNVARPSGTASNSWFTKHFILRNATTMIAFKIAFHSLGILELYMPFPYNVWVYHNFPCKEQTCFNIPATVTFRGDCSNELFLPAAPPRPLRPEARPPHAPKLLLTLPLSPSVFCFAQCPAPRRPGSAESPPPGRSALSRRVRAASHKPGSGARRVAVSQVSVSFSLSN